MKRIYFLALRLAVAQRAIDELLLARIEARQIHVDPLTPRFPQPSSSRADAGGNLQE